MNKILLAVVAVALIAGGVFAFTSSSDEAEPEAAQTTTTTQEEVAQPADEAEETIEAPAVGMGEVVAYSEEALRNSTTENNVIFFHAEWCSVCNSVDRNLQAANIPDDLTIFKLDYDSAEGQRLKDVYSIPIQYTMVQVQTDGTEITQWVNQFNYGINEIVEQLI